MDYTLYIFYEETYIQTTKNFR